MSYTGEAFEAYWREVQALNGLTEAEVDAYAACVGDCVELDDQGRAVIRRNGEVVARLKLPLDDADAGEDS